MTSRQHSPIAEGVQGAVLLHPGERVRVVVQEQASLASDALARILGLALEIFEARQGRHLQDFRLEV
eukprot:13090667-Alexandrium_andersonii.AAC.1